MEASRGEFQHLETRELFNLKKLSLQEHLQEQQELPSHSTYKPLGGETFPDTPKTKATRASCTSSAPHLHYMEWLEVERTPEGRLFALPAAYRDTHGSSSAHSPRSPTPAAGREMPHRPTCDAVPQDAELGHVPFPPHSDSRQTDAEPLSAAVPQPQEGAQTQRHGQGRLRERRGRQRGRSAPRSAGTAGPLPCRAPRRARRAGSPSPGRTPAGRAPASPPR